MVTRAPDTISSIDTSANPRSANSDRAVATSAARVAAAYSSLRVNKMTTYLIERHIPGAGKLSPEELRAISKQSVGVLSSLGDQIRWLSLDHRAGFVLSQPNLRTATVAHDLDHPQLIALLTASHSPARLAAGPLIITALCRSRYD